MSDEIEEDETAGMSRRDSIRRAAAMALAAGLGAPQPLPGMPPAGVRLQLKFYKSASDGGALVGAIELTDAVTAFIGSASGARAQVRWYDWNAKELGTMGIPSMIQDKTRLLMSALPPGD